MKMIIHNFSQLNKGQAQSKALQVLNAGLESTMPQKKIEKIINKILDLYDEDGKKYIRTII